MEREFLKGLGLEKDAIDKIMAENGKDIELEKGKVKDIQSQLVTANNTIKERDKQLETLKNSPDNPETLYTVVIKGITEDGTCKKVILENMMLSAPTVETHLFGVEEIIDRRSNMKR